MEKQVAFITEPTILAASDLWPLDEKVHGKFVFRAQVVAEKADRKHFTPGAQMQSSLLVHVDIEAGEFETLNTRYRVIPKHLVDVYRMAIPQ